MLVLGPYEYICIYECDVFSLFFAVLLVSCLFFHVFTHDVKIRLADGVKQYDKRRMLTKKTNNNTVGLAQVTVPSGELP